MTIEEKLRHFEEASMEQARAESLAIIAKHKDALEQLEEEHKKTKIRQAELEIKSETNRLKQHINMELSKEQLKIKRRITLLHNELKEKLFNEVREKLDLYMSSPEYERLLLRQIDKILAVAKNDQVTIYIDPSDESKLAALQSKIQVPIKVAQEQSFIGGTRGILTKRHILIDYSFASRLDEEIDIFTFEGGISHE